MTTLYEPLLDMITLELDWRLDDEAELLLELICDLTSSVKEFLREFVSDIDACNKKDHEMPSTKADQDK